MTSDHDESRSGVAWDVVIPNEYIAAAQSGDR